MEEVREKLPSIKSEDDFERVCAILSPQEPCDEDGEFEPPNADMTMIERYQDYLKEHLPRGMLLKGRESMGYFSWEERFIWGKHDSSEYYELKQEYACLDDELKLINLDDIDDEVGIIAKVRRGDKKIFYIPLADLEAVKQNKSITNLVDDYGMYITNYLEY